MRRDDAQDFSASGPRKDWWDKHKRWFEIAGVVILTIYTAYTVKMYHANKEAADAARSAAVTSASALKSSNKSFEKTLAHMRAQPLAQQDAASIAKRAADTSVSTLKQSEKAFVVEERPYIVVTAPYSLTRHPRTVRPRPAWC